MKLLFGRDKDLFFPFAYSFNVRIDCLRQIDTGQGINSSQENEIVGNISFFLLGVTRILGYRGFRFYFLDD